MAKLSLIYLPTLPSYSYIFNLIEASDMKDNYTDNFLMKYIIVDKLNLS